MGEGGQYQATCLNKASGASATWPPVQLLDPAFGSLLPIHLGPLTSHSDMSGRL